MSIYTNFNDFLQQAVNNADLACRNRFGVPLTQGYKVSSLRVGQTSCRLSLSDAIRLTAQCYHQPYMASCANRADIDSLLVSASSRLLFRITGS